MRRSAGVFAKVLAAMLALAILLPVAAVASSPPILMSTDDQNGGNRRIASVWPNGSGFSYLTTDGLSGDPTWSGDGTQIAYRRYENEIWLMRGDGSGKRLLIRWPEHVIALAWSPDGRYLAISDAVEVMTGMSPCRIFRYDLLTGASTQLYKSYPEGFIYDVSWSPDGTKIMFLTEYGDGSSCDILDVASKVITPFGVAGAREATWSWSSGRIAFAKMIAADYSQPGDRLGIFNPTTNSVSYPFQSDTYIGGLTWSPYDDQLAMDYGTGISVINADGSGLSNLPIPSAYSWGPKWRPLLTKAGTVLSSSVAATVGYGKAATFTSVLTDEPGQPIAGVSVVIQGSTNARNWTSVATTTTSATGRVSASVRPTTTTYYRAMFVGKWLVSVLLESSAAREAAGLLEHTQDLVAFGPHVLGVRLLEATTRCRLQAGQGVRLSADVERAVP